MRQFFLKHGTLQFLSSVNLTAYATLDFIAALKKTHLVAPFYISDEQLHALTQLADIFASSIMPKSIPSNTASPRLLNCPNPLEKPWVPSKNDNKPREDNTSASSQSYLTHLKQNHDIISDHAHGQIICSTTSSCA